MVIRLKPQARADLVALRVWSEAEWGNVKTRDYLSGLKQAFARLAGNPAIGRSCELFGPGIRSWNYRGQIIFYRPIENGISILRVLHERRNQAALDFADQAQR